LLQDITRSTTLEGFSQETIISVHCEKNDLGSYPLFFNWRTASRPFITGIEISDDYDIGVKATSGFNEGLAVCDSSDQIEFILKETLQVPERTSCGRQPGVVEDGFIVISLPEFWQ
jgi:hypothetical protein